MSFSERYSIEEAVEHTESYLGRVLTLMFTLWGGAAAIYELSVLTLGFSRESAVAWACVIVVFTLAFLSIYIRFSRKERRLKRRLKEEIKKKEEEFTWRYSPLRAGKEKLSSQIADLKPLAEEFIKEYITKGKTRRFAAPEDPSYKTSLLVDLKEAVLRLECLEVFAKITAAEIERYCEDKGISLKHVMIAAHIDGSPVLASRVSQLLGCDMSLCYSTPLKFAIALGKSKWAIDPDILFNRRDVFFFVHDANWALEDSVDVCGLYLDRGAGKVIYVVLVNRIRKDLFEPKFRALEEAAVRLGAEADSIRIFTFSDLALAEMWESSESRREV